MQAVLPCVLVLAAVAALCSGRCVFGSHVAGDNREAPALPFCCWLPDSACCAPAATSRLARVLAGVAERAHLLPHNQCFLGLVGLACMPCVPAHTRTTGALCPSYCEDVFSDCRPHLDALTNAFLLKAPPTEARELCSAVLLAGAREGLALPGAHALGNTTALVAPPGSRACYAGPSKEIVKCSACFQAQWPVHTDDCSGTVSSTAQRPRRTLTDDTDKSDRGDASSENDSNFNENSLSEDFPWESDSSDSSDSIIDSSSDVSSDSMDSGDNSDSEEDSISSCTQIPLFGTQCAKIEPSGDCQLNLEVTSRSDTVLDTVFSLDEIRQDPESDRFCAAVPRDQGLPCAFCARFANISATDTSLSLCATLHVSCSVLAQLDFPLGCQTFPYSAEQCGSLDCPANCSGHGTCINFRCKCDEGFSGDDCSRDCNHHTAVLPLLLSSSTPSSLYAPATYATDAAAPLVAVVPAVPALSRLEIVALLSTVGAAPSPAPSSAPPSTSSGAPPAATPALPRASPPPASTPDVPESDKRTARQETGARLVLYAKQGCAPSRADFDHRWTVRVADGAVVYGLVDDVCSAPDRTAEDAAWYVAGECLLGASNTNVPCNFTVGAAVDHAVGGLRGDWFDADSGTTAFLRGPHCRRLSFETSRVIDLEIDVTDYGTEKSFDVDLMLSRADCPSRGNAQVVVPLRAKNGTSHRGGIVVKYRYSVGSTPETKGLPLSGKWWVCVEQPSGTAGLCKNFPATCLSQPAVSISASRGERVPPVCEPPCHHGGECRDGNICLCAGTGYHGLLCEEALCLPGCYKGKCVSPNQCECDLGWSGPSCIDFMRNHNTTGTSSSDSPDWATLTLVALVAAVAVCLLLAALAAFCCVRWCVQRRRGDLRYTHLGEEGL